MADPMNFGISQLLAQPDPTQYMNQQIAAQQQQQQNANILQQQQVSAANAAQDRALQIAAAQRGMAATQAAQANPTPQNIFNLTLARPDIAPAIKDAHDQLQGDQQKQNIQDTSAVYGYLQAGNTNAAAARVQQRIDADSAAGKDTSADTAMLQQINSDPKGAAAAAGTQLAGQMGPDQFAAAYGAVKKGAVDDAKLPGELAAQGADVAKTQAETSQITNPRPKTTAIVDPSTNTVQYYNENAPPPATGGGPGAPGGTSSSLQSWAAQMQGAENSTGNPSAQNPRSSATGNGQFLNGTWLQLMKSSQPDLTAGKSDAQILAMRSDPAISAQATIAYAQQNAPFLSSAGAPVNGATLAMAHRLGPGGALSVLKADSNAPLTSVLPANVIAANPQLKNETVGSYLNSNIAQFGVQPITTQNTPGLTGTAYLATLPPQEASVVKAMAEGRMAIPTGRAATSGSGASILKQVFQYDPMADISTLHQRQAAETAFNTGTQGQNITAANTAIDHAVQLSKDIDQLQNGGVPIGNWITQAVQPAFGNTAKASALSAFNSDKQAFVTELTKTLSGGVPTDSEIKYWDTQLNSASSPEALKAVIQNAGNLMNSRLQELAAAKSQALQRPVAVTELLSPHAQRMLPALNVPTPTQIQALRQAPQMAAQFDQKFGPGISAHYLQPGGQ